MSNVAHLTTDTQTLTGSQVASENTAKVSGDLHTAYITYTPATNSTNALEVQFEMSPDDGNTWFKVGQYTNSSGTLTEQPYTISDASAGTSAQYLVPLTFSASGTHVRALVTETNTPGAYGTVQIDLLTRSSSAV